MTGQTSIVIRLPDRDVLVRIAGQHIDPTMIQVDDRLAPTQSWYPIRMVEVRHE